MPWWRKEPGHLQQWHWPCSPSIVHFQHQNSLIKSTYHYSSWIKSCTYTCHRPFLDGQPRLGKWSAKSHQSTKKCQNHKTVIRQRWFYFFFFLPDLSILLLALQWCVIRIIVYLISGSWTVYSTAVQANKKNPQKTHQNSIWLVLCKRNLQVTGGLPSRRASNMKRASISWLHQEAGKNLKILMPEHCQPSRDPPRHSTRRSDRSSHMPPYRRYPSQPHRTEPSTNAEMDRWR